MDGRLMLVGLIREELDDSEPPLNPPQKTSPKAMSGCLVRKHHQRSRKRMTKQSKNNERRRQNAGEKAMSGSSGNKEFT
jgi:hypothetical protein